ncbi:MAG: ABC transporter substrate-binding protein, partial [Pseudomonadales bacterium]|nr:ABC transporter substrate-binding protein [Pseudomonadales bacterium]
MLVKLSLPLLKPLFQTGDYHNRKANQSIALVLSTRPETRDINRAIKDGVTFYLKNRLSLGEGKRMPELLVFDDQGDLARAEEIAKSLAAREDVLAVIGHVDATLSLAVAPIYQSAGLPLLSVVASDDQLMSVDNGLFSIHSTDRRQGRFMAGYAVYALNKFKATVIRSDADNPGHRSWLQGFADVAEEEGLDWKELRLGDFGDPSTLESAYEHLLASHPDIVFLAVDAEQAEALVKLLRNKGFQQTVVLPSALATPAFAQRFSALSREKKLGYYTNGLLVPVPFVLDMANERAQQVNEKYHQVTGVDISWPFALAHDATQVLLEVYSRELNAIAATQPGEARLPGRQDIKAGLTAVNSLQRASEGVSGPVFFSDSATELKPLLMATFQNRTLISALTQLLPSEIPADIYDPFEHVGMISFSGSVFHLSHAVYTGVRVNRLSNINPDRRTFDADFEIWFRYYGQFNPG